VQLEDLGIDSLGLAELVNQLELSFGEGSISIDDVLDATLRQVAAKLCAGADSKMPGAGLAATIDFVWNVCVQVIGDDDAPDKAEDPDVQLEDLGIDSLGLAELVNQLELSFGEGSISIDDVLDATLRQVAAKLCAGAASKMPPPPSSSTSLTEEKKEMGTVVGAAFAIDIDLSSLDSTNEDWNWIRTTHVGSLPRNLPDTKELLTTDAIIAKQIVTGISCINDGESTRENYVSEALSRMSGIGFGIGGKSVASGCLCEMPCAADMLDVPLYSQRFTGGNGIITLNPRRPALNDVACVAPPVYAVDGAERLAMTLVPFLTAIKKVGRSPESCFWSVPSPGTLAMFCENQWSQEDHKAYVMAFARALQTEYEVIAATGVVLQVDCPDLAMGHHTRHANCTAEEFLSEIAAVNVAALNAALVNVPKEQVRVHICWGNYAGPHHKDLGADRIWPIIGDLKAKFILIEAANPRHVHEVSAFERAVARGDFNADQVIVPGVIDTTAARVEHPQAIAERLLRFVRAAGHPSRVMAGTDCGFASTAKSVAVTSDIAWRKIAALVEGAQLATKLYLECQAPVPVHQPKFNPTVFRCAVVTTKRETPDTLAYAGVLAQKLGGRAAFTDFFELSDATTGACQTAFAALRWAVDSPLAVVGVGDSGHQAAMTVRGLLEADKSVSRRPSCVFLTAEPFTGSSGSSSSALAALAGAHSRAVDLTCVNQNEDPAAIATLVAQEMAKNLGFDKRQLVLAPKKEIMTNTASVFPPQNNKELVVVVGAGILGLIAAKRLTDEGFDVAILEQRLMVGGIWSMYANSTSQVNSSEGGYCIKEFLPKAFEGRHENRDHSTAAEMLTDLKALAGSLESSIYTEVTVSKILGEKGDYTVIASHASGKPGSVAVIKARGVVLAINDRVGTPRPLPRLGLQAFEASGGFICDGAGDATTGYDWRGKSVVVFGMGAFAIENVRTALEGGAAKVTVVARRHGTICPKIIDYLNFVKPWECVEGEFKHDVGTNVKQMGQWRKLYKASGATTPECWPGKVKHDGHTISVSDIWFVGHHLGKLDTQVGTFARLQEGGVVLDSGVVLPCDVVIGCIGFHRSHTLAESLTGRSDLSHSNYLDKDMIYLADAEIDENAFNSFYGSSVTEYGKFWTKVYVEGLKRSDELGEKLWGARVPYTPIKSRKWSQYIASAANLIRTDSTLEGAAWDLVNNRTQHFNDTMPPTSFVEVNKREWQELHTRLNGGVPVPAEDQLPYFFNEAASWC